MFSSYLHRLLKISDNRDKFSLSEAIPFIRSLLYLVDAKCIECKTNINVARIHGSVCVLSAGITLKRFVHLRTPSIITFVTFEWPEDEKHTRDQQWGDRPRQLEKRRT